MKKKPPWLVEHIASIAGTRALGINPKAKGTNPRSLGTNPRALGTNPRALGTNPKALRRRRRRPADEV